MQTYPQSQYIPRLFPRCAVLLAAYNGEKWINEQIETILKQIGVEVTLFVSVDFSTDSTLSMIKSWQAKDDRVHLLPYGDRYGGAGRNFFRLIADVDTDSYDLVAFADQDDIWFESKLSFAWKKISLDECDVYSSDVLALWADGRTELVKKSYPQRKYDHFFEAGGAGCTYVFSSAVFKSVRRFVICNYDSCSELQLHDWLIYAYCREQKFRWFIDDRPTMLYRQHANNQMGTNNNLLTYWRRTSQVRNKWYLRQIMAIIQLVGGPSYLRLTSRKFILTNSCDLRRRPRDQYTLFLLALVGLF